MSVSQQCAVLDLPRSSFYYQPVGVSEEDLRLMRLLDEQYTATPFYGSRRMQVALQRAGHGVNRKHVQRLMRVMGLEAVGPTPRLSEPHPGHKVYPYLLRDVPITRVDQVWSTDITYVRFKVDPIVQTDFGVEIVKVFFPYTGAEASPEAEAPPPVEPTRLSPPRTRRPASGTGATGGAAPGCRTGSTGPVAPARRAPSGSPSGTLPRT